MTPEGYPAFSDFDEVSVEDRLRIQDQVARYAWAFDSGNLEEYLGRFWPDGALEHPKRDGSPGRFEGHEGIRTFIRDFEGRSTQTWGHQHQINTFAFERRGPAEIRLSAYVCVLRHEFHRTYWPMGSSFRVGTWHADYTQRDGQWRISLLRVRMWTDVSIGNTGVDAAERPLHSPGTRQ
ncbi:nuclear transport factor 2 family protein [Microbacterium album]|uniref:SnoaL-like domain-containing protein n=1 Tax=Microbacterium album TaxID=2053191 RepID=A0A917ML92_9MICO|nr:nuclear transport factor 2 family protein [Microbacterium album]GGH41007.1 hypothetical protein GCM10010921_13310 [Microbacterium album]